MNFLPMLEFATLSQETAILDTKTKYIILAVLAAAAVIFYLVKTRKENAATVTEDTADVTVINPKESSAEVSADEVSDKATETETVDLPYTPGYITLDGVREQDAAVIMAITSENTGIPLERLCFKYIRRLNQNPVLENIEEQDAAVIMAIVANKLDTPIENLCFNSIKLQEN